MVATSSSSGLFLFTTVYYTMYGIAHYDLSHNRLIYHGVSETGDTSPWYMGESQDSIMHNINNVFGPQILLGEDPSNIERVVARKGNAGQGWH